MSAVLTSILLDAATRVGAPIVKDLLTNTIGGPIGEIGGAVIDVIAGHAGVAPAQLPELPAKDLDAAVAKAEAEAPELLVQWNRQQEQAIALMKAEMDKNEAVWTWAWRPAWMWLLAALWTYALVLRPMINTAAGAAIEAVDLESLTWLTTAYLALYMGGHTFKASKWAAGQ